MVVKFLIYPAVGIARIGPADEFFYGPEQPVPAEVGGKEWEPLRMSFPPTAAAGTNPGKFRDASGDILRQAARFRVYKVTFRKRTLKKPNQAARIVLLPKRAELVDLRGANVECEWTVKVANKKSYRSSLRPDFNRPSPGGRVWNQAQGSVFAAGGFAGGRIIPLVGSETISGRRFLLAEIFTDDVGRLVVLGGKGDMHGPDGDLPDLFHRGWFDDICDGSVECTLKIDDQDKTVERGWVVCGLPSFAPSVPSVVSLYDIAGSLADRRGQVRFPSPVSYERDVYPILEVAARQQPVSKDAIDEHFTLDEEAVDRASSLGKRSKAKTSGKRVYLLLQKPGSKFKKRARPYDAAAKEAVHDTDAYDLYKHRIVNSTQKHKMPLQIGLAYTRYQCRILNHWSNGNFSEYLTAGTPPAWQRPAFNALTPIKQIDSLNHAHMGAMLGASTIPGIEVCYRAQKWSTWDKSMGFRIADSLEPGELTEGLSVPWIADYYRCYRQKVGSSTKEIEWWPSHRPITVLQETKTDPDKEMVEWDRNWDLTVPKQENWKKLGFVNLVDTRGGTSWRREHERV